MSWTVPSTWCLSTIGEVTADSSQRVPADNETFAYIDIASINRDTKHIEEPLRLKGKDAPSRARKVVRAGDVLVSMTRPNLNAVAMVPAELDDQIASTGLDVLRASNIDARWLYYLVRSADFVQAMSDLVQGALYPAIRSKDVRSFEIPVAPLAEQKRIADKLDTLLARVDACRDRLDRVPAILKRFRQSVLTAATSGRLTEDWRGGAKTNWPRLRAEEVCSKVQSGGTPKGGFLENGVPFLKVYNIVDQKVKFDYKPQYVSLDIHATELRKSQAQPGDVLMNIVGPPLGKVAIVPADHATWNINQAITLFRPSKQISSQWIYIVLCEGAPIREVLDRTKGSVGQVNISLSQCRAFELPVPSVEEQAAIVSRVEKLFAFADKLEARLFIGRKQAERLTPAILAKAFRGELVPQDPNDEPAAALLERIRMGGATAQAQLGTSTRGRPRKRLA